VKIQERTKNLKIAKNRNIHNTSTRGVQRSAPPQAGLLLVL
jgi:hypothetical protein